MLRILKYRRYTHTVIFHRIKSFLQPVKAKNKYLFVLGATHGGTTLMNEILSTSNKVSSSNNKHTREGQLLPTVADHMFLHKKQWNEEIDFNWSFIKNEWRKYWDTTKPILLEKSPPNLLRAFSIQKVFQPSYFIILVRNPYAHCETFIRKNGYSPVEAASFVIKTLRYQKKNLNHLKNSILITYELLVDNPVAFRDKISNFLPELINVRLEGRFDAHNYYNKPQKLINFNHEKISRLKKHQIEEINIVLKQNLELIHFFGYSLKEY